MRSEGQLSLGSSSDESCHVSFPLYQRNAIYESTKKLIEKDGRHLEFFSKGYVHGFSPKFQIASSFE